MAELLWRRARKEASQIRRAQPIGSHGLGDLKAIARTWDATVEEAPLEDEVSGFIIKQEGTDPRIYINMFDTPERKRFTLAHEIGHLVERDSVANDPEYSFMDYRKTDSYDLHEFFADEFAGELLMPAGKLIRIYSDGGAYAAARTFGVSVPAVKKRMQRLVKNKPEFIG